MFVYYAHPPCSRSLALYFSLFLSLCSCSPTSYAFLLLSSHRSATGSLPSLCARSPSNQNVLSLLEESDAINATSSTSFRPKVRIAARRRTCFVDMPVYHARRSSRNVRSSATNAWKVQRALRRRSHCLLHNSERSPADFICRGPRLSIHHTHHAQFVSVTLHHDGRVA